MSKQMSKKLLSRLKALGIETIDDSARITNRVTWGVVDKFEAFNTLRKVMEHWAENGIDGNYYTINLHTLSPKDEKSLNRYLSGSRNRSHYKLIQAFNEAFRRLIKQTPALKGKVRARISINNDTVTIGPVD